MADDSDGGRSLALPLMLAGLAGSGLAIVASGGLALLGGAIAAACLAGSVVASLAPDPAEGPCLPECLPAASVSVEVESGPSQEAGQSQQWQRTVASSRSGCRGR